MVPGLLDDMQKDFQSQYDSSEKIQSLNEKLNNGTATYKEANEYASEVGSITRNTYETHLTSDTLPDGKCYYNIAERVTSSTLHNQYELVADYTEQVQTDLNKKAGIGLKAQRADEDTDGYHSLANYMSSAENYDDIAKSTAQSAERFARSTVDNSVKKNTEFQGKAGLKPKIIRSGGSGCCEWCSGLTGKYDYPDVPSDVYARHNNCTCTVEYSPGDGRRQDVWSKTWSSAEEVEERKTIGLDTSDKNDKIEKRKNTGKKTSLQEKKSNISKALIKQATISNDSSILVDAIIENHEALAEITPQQMKNALETLGYEVKPLGRSKSGFTGVEFEDGGGFRTSFGGDGYLQYHPEGGTHNISYWKINNGERGKHWYDTDGREFDPRKKD